MEPTTKAYSPEQMAQGMMDDGSEVIVLYIKEFHDQLNQVNKHGKQGYFYTWSTMEDLDSNILFICWDDGEEIAIQFTRDQEEIVKALIMPKHLIITALPLNQLIENAENTGQDFFDLNGPAVILNDVVFRDPKEMQN